MDRIFKSKEDGIIFTVEYKSDNQTHKTKNIFVETISVIEKNKIGWAYSSWAQLIIYYVKHLEYAHIADMAMIKIRLSKWIKKYPIRDIPNIKNGETYHTRGILVPEQEFLKCVIETKIIE